MNRSVVFALALCLAIGCGSPAPGPGGDPGGPDSGTPPTREAPGAPTSVHATGEESGARVTWTAPASDGGSPITGYVVTANPGGKTAESEGAGTEARVTGLDDGTTYTFTVTARNAIGTGPSSEPSNPVMPPGHPWVATDVVAEAGDRQATVSWTAPTITGDGPLTGYTVRSEPDGKTAHASPGETRAIVTGLRNGTAYTFTVTAANAVGEGPASAPSNAIVPEAPTTALLSVATLTPALAQDADHLYAVDADTTPVGSSARFRLLKVAKAGGAAVALAGQLEPQPSDLAVDGGYLYFAHWTHLRRVPVAGGAVEELAPYGGAYRGLGIDASFVYTEMADPAGGYAIARVPKAGGEPVILAHSPQALYRVAVDADRVYWVHGEGGTGGVSAVAKAGGTATLLAAASAPLCLGLDAANVFWCEPQGTGSLLSVPKSGGTAATLASGHGNPDAIAVANGSVYWTGATAGVWRVPASGGAEEFLHASNADQLAVDDTHVYWFGLDYAAQHSTLWSMPLP